MSLTADQTLEDLNELKGQKTLSRMQHRDENREERLGYVDTGGEHAARINGVPEGKEKEKGQYLKNSRVFSRTDERH